MSRFIFITKGIPASGKGTWSKEQMKKFPKKFKRINNDLFRRMLDNSVFSTKNEKFVNKLKNQIIKTSLRNGYDVILDNTNFYHKIWFEMCEMAKQIGDVHVVEKFFNIELKEAIKRNSERSDDEKVPEHVIKEMYNKYIKGKRVLVRSEYFYPVLEKEKDPNKKNAIIVDLDGTLALNEFNNRDYYDYTKVDEDEPDMTIKELINLYSENGTSIIIISGREDSCFDITNEWLNVYEIYYDGMFMRKTGDRREDWEIKKEIYEKFIEPKYNILFVLDDRNQVVDLWRSLGLKCFQVADGEF